MSFNEKPTTGAEIAITRSVEDLKGVPVEAAFEGGKLVSWRILEEVL